MRRRQLRRKVFERSLTGWPCTLAFRKTVRQLGQCRPTASELRIQEGFIDILELDIFTSLQPTRDNSPINSAFTTRADEDGATCHLGFSAAAETNSTVYSSVRGSGQKRYEALPREPQVRLHRNKDLGHADSLC